MKTNILGASTSLTRMLALLILNRGAYSLSAATKLISAARREPGDFSHVVLKHDVPTAFELAEQIRRVRAIRKQRCGFRSHEWYGNRRGPGFTVEQFNLRGERVRLAERFRTEPLEQRLRTQRRLSVLEAAQRVMKYGAAGGSEFHVQSGDEPDYHVEVTKDWRRVNSGKDTWASNVDHHHITVSRSWLGVHRRIGDGTAVIDRRFLLDARLFLEAGERRVWEATLARTGRGFHAVVEGVWLSCYGRDVTVHANLKKALAAVPPEGSPVEHCEDEEFLASLIAA